MVTTTGVQAQHEGNRPRQFYAACENEGCGVCGPIRSTEGAAHDDAREHAKVCSSGNRDEPLGYCTVHGPRGLHGPYWTDECPRC